MTKPMSTPHVGDSVNVWLVDLINDETGERVDDPDYDVTIVAPSGTNPTASAAREVTDENGNPAWICTFVPAVAGEHVIKTQAEADGITFRHVELMRVMPW